MQEFYGTEHQEELDSTPEEVIERLMDNENYSSFPIKVYVFKKMQIAKNADSLSKDILDDLIERLDENYGNPDGEDTKPTENMKKASLRLAEVFLSDYKPHACESTGEVLEYSKEQAEEIIK